MCIRDSMKAIREVFAINDKKRAGLSLVEDIADSEKFHPIRFKEVIVNGILPAIEKANPENIEAFRRIMPFIEKPESLESGTIKSFLEKNVNLY